MFPFYDDAIVKKVIPILELNCPSPESSLNALSGIITNTFSGEQSELINRVLFDIDDFVSQIRWHLGQALCLMELQNSFEPKEKSLLDYGAPVIALNLLRPLIKEKDKVFFTDLSESRQGGNAAGWIFHMMIDNAIYRSVAALDMLAHLLWNVAALKPGNVYFRTKKLQTIAQALSSEDVSPLVKIANSELFELILNYRNGFSHQAKAYCLSSGPIPAQIKGTELRPSDYAWDNENLFALGNAAYTQLCEALRYLVPICQKNLKQVNA